MLPEFEILFKGVHEKNQHFAHETYYPKHQ